MKSLGWIHSVRPETTCVIVTTRQADGELAVHNVPHHDWNRLLHSVGATSDNETIGRELITRLELVDPTTT